ncbi:hypothetical protein L7F22_056798, partial [Adiantum nelumboides]|nr:hypothetical protein [Adiantum nelumboides]
MAAGNDFVIVLYRMVVPLMGGKHCGRGLAISGSRGHPVADVGCLAHPQEPTDLL